MSQYRYRDHSGGVTNPSLRCVVKNLHKIGQPYLIRGYRWIGKHGVDWEGILVKGEKGTARFEGFLWGYGGTGPRGLVQLLIRLGVKRKDAQRIAHDTPRLDKAGTDWEIEIKANAYVFRATNQEPVSFAA